MSREPSLQDPLRFNRKTPPCAVVIFGANGDLTKRKLMPALYRLAWERGLKTTYYLRSRSATHVEKSTLKGTDGKLNAVSVAPVAASAPRQIIVPQVEEASAVWGKACSIEDPTCEACQ